MFGWSKEIERRQNGSREIISRLRRECSRTKLVDQGEARTMSDFEHVLKRQAQSTVRSSTENAGERQIWHLLDPAQQSIVFTVF